MTTEKIKQNYSDETRLALLEQSINNINNALLRIEQRMAEDRAEIRTYFKWTMTGIFGTYAIMISSLVAVFLKFYH